MLQTVVVGKARIRHTETALGSVLSLGCAEAGADFQLTDGPTGVTRVLATCAKRSVQRSLCVLNIAYCIG